MDRRGREKADASLHALTAPPGLDTTWSCAGPFLGSGPRGFVASTLPGESRAPVPVDDMAGAAIAIGLAIGRLVSGVVSPMDRLRLGYRACMATRATVRSPSASLTGLPLHGTLRIRGREQMRGLAWDRWPETRSPRRTSGIVERMIGMATIRARAPDTEAREPVVPGDPQLVLGLEGVYRALGQGELDPSGEFGGFLHGVISGYERKPGLSRWIDENQPASHHQSRTRSARE